MSSNDKQNRTINRLIIALVITVALLLILGWYFINRSSPSSTENLLLAIIPNLLSPLLVALVLYFAFGKKIIDIDNRMNQSNQNMETLTEYFKSELTLLKQQITSISHSTVESKGMYDLIEQKLLDLHNHFSNLIPEKIDNLFSLLTNVLEGQGTERIPELDSLTGHWVEYISSRKKIGCEYSLAKFEYNEEKRTYCFSGTSYDLFNKTHQYKWRSVLLLTPRKITEDKFFIYYFYQRLDNTNHAGKYGIGKLVAKYEHDKFNLVQGFFFNEATRHESFDMVLKRLPEVSNILNFPIAGQEENRQQILKLFNILNESKIYEKWEFNENDNIDEKNTGTLIKMAR